MVTIKRGDSIYEILTNREGSIVINLYKNLVFDRTIEIAIDEQLIERRVSN